jgi:hypothetical protein
MTNTQINRLIQLIEQNSGPNSEQRELLKQLIISYIRQKERIRRLKNSLARQDAKISALMR